MSDPFIYQIFAGGLVSIINFGIHALMTGLVVVMTRRIAGRTDALHVFIRVFALLMVTANALMVAHVAEIVAWPNLYTWMGVGTSAASPFEFAFENYTALGYGDAVPGGGYRLIGPITSLNGLLLIGWSVAIIFEVLKMADVQVGRREKRTR